MQLPTTRSRFGKNHQEEREQGWERRRRGGLAAVAGQPVAAGDGDEVERSKVAATGEILIAPRVGTQGQHGEGGVTDPALNPRSPS